MIETNPESAPTDQQYPYRDASPAAIGGVIVELDDLILAAARRRLTKRHAEHVDDVAQECRLALVLALRHYDVSRGARVSTFAYRVVHRTISNELEKLDGRP